MPTTWYFTTPPTAEPITLSQAKRHLREDDTGQDDLITALISAAREKVEGMACRQLMPAVVREYFDNFPFSENHFSDLPLPGFALGYGFGAGLTTAGGGTRATMRLSVVPTVSITSINYLDPNGDAQVMDSSLYGVDVRSEPARIQPIFGQVWPTIQWAVQNAVWVEYSVGYASAAAVPATLKAAMMLMIGGWYENREAISDLSLTEVPFAAKAMVDRWTMYTH